MTPTDEARFIELWNAGTATAALAKQLGIPRGTAGSRAHALQRQGKIQPRPKGGKYPLQRRQRRQEELPAPQVPPVSHAPHTTPTAPVMQWPPAPPTTTVPTALTFVAVPEIQEMFILMQDLHARVVSLEQTRVSPALPAPPAVERKDIQQWTVRLSKALIDHLKAVAYERRIPPSQLVEDLVWTALTNQAPSTPEPVSTPHKTSSWNR